jgi:hypothetical protein
MKVYLFMIHLMVSVTYITWYWVVGLQCVYVIECVLDVFTGICLVNFILD